MRKKIATQMNNINCFVRNHVAISLIVVIMLAFGGNMLTLLLLQTGKDPSDNAVIDDPQLPSSSIGTVFYINAVTEIANYDFAEGSFIRALGYNAPDDGMMCEYKVVSDYTGFIDGCTQISLLNGNTAVMQESTTSVAYIGQFGAVGDGIADNKNAIQAAFDSQYSTIVFSPGEYRVNSDLYVKNGMKSILGLDGSTIFTDRAYNSQRKFFITIAADSFQLKDMTIETREFSQGKYLSQVMIMECANVALDYCNINVFPMNEVTHYTNVDLYAGWENVRIDHCTLTLMNDGDHGSNIAVRDLRSSGGKGAQISNNTIYKKGRDEILWIYGEEAELSDILVTGNTFTMEKPVKNAVSPSVIVISSDDSLVRNIEFSDNVVTADASYALFTISNAHDVLVANNELTFNTVGSASASNIINSYASKGATSNTHTTLETKNVTIKNNAITVNAKETSAHILFSVGGVVTDNTVTVNGNIDTLVTGKVTNFAGNELTVNGNVQTAITRNVYDVEDNAITINGEARQVFEYINTTIEKDAVLELNRVTVRDGKLANSDILLTLNEVNMAAKTVSLLSNEIICGLDEYKQYISGVLEIADNPLTSLMTGNSVVATVSSKARKLYHLKINDADQQYVVFGDNTIFGYQSMYANRKAAESGANRDIALSIDNMDENLESTGEQPVATIIDAAGKTTNSLSLSNYVANTVWSNSASQEAGQ